jgi:hypothetical protein
MLAFDVAKVWLGVGRRVLTGTVKVHLRLELAPIYMNREKARRISSIRRKRRAGVEYL